MSEQAFTVIAQAWEESERDWGVRPDGFSLHLTMNDCRQFREEFWNQQLAHNGSKVPDEYSRTSGEPYLVRVDMSTHQQLLSGADADHLGKHGHWYYRGEVPQPEPFGGPRAYQMFSDPLIMQACAAAEQGFADKQRKVPEGSGKTGEPYVSHLHSVASCLMEFGFRPEVVAAGYLHDHIEDLPALWSKQRIQQEFGVDVANLVDWVTQQDKSLSWEVRTQRYAERLQHAPQEAIAISVADKISNMGDLLYWMRQGYPVAAVLKRDWQANLDTIQRLMSIYEANVPQAMFLRISNLFEEYKTLPS